MNSGIPSRAARVEPPAVWETDEFRSAPVQSGDTPHVLWEVHEAAYAEYHRRFSNAQTAERIAERGGFSWPELVELLWARHPDNPRREVPKT